MNDLLSLANQLENVATQIRHNVNLSAKILIAGSPFTVEGWTLLKRKALNRYFKPCYNLTPQSLGLKGQYQTHLGTIVSLAREWAKKTIYQWGSDESVQINFEDQWYQRPEVFMGIADALRLERPNVEIIVYAPLGLITHSGEVWRYLEGVQNHPEIDSLSVRTYDAYDDDTIRGGKENARKVYSNYVNAAYEAYTSWAPTKKLYASLSFRHSGHRDSQNTNIDPEEMFYNLQAIRSAGFTNYFWFDWRGDDWDSEKAAENADFLLDRLHY